MYKPGHFGLGLLSSAPFVLIALELGRPVWAALFIIAGTSTALFPDVDQKDIVPFKHHGATHTVLFGLVVSVVCTALLLVVMNSAVELTSGTQFSIHAPSLLEKILLAALLFAVSVLGYASHLLGDALSSAGGTLLIRPWKPFSDNFIQFGIANAGNPYFNYGFLVSGAGSLVTLALMYAL